MTKGQSNQNNQQIRQLLGAFLNRGEESDNFTSNERHLDEDALSAFVEGNLNSRETVPIMRHLVDCGLCRKITVQLVRLAIEFEDAPEIVSAVPQPSRLQKFFSSLTARNFGFADDAVFAHHEPDENESESSGEEDRTQKISDE